MIKTSVYRRLTFLLLRALPGKMEVTFEWERSCTVRQGVEPWKASWQRVQKSKRQLERVQVALWASVRCFAGEPQRLQWHRDSCCFRLLAAWTTNMHLSKLISEHHKQQTLIWMSEINSTVNAVWMTNTHLHVFLEARTLRLGCATLLRGSRPSVDLAA